LLGDLLEKGLLAVALLAAAGLSALATMRVVLTAQEVVVPSLIDQRVPEAGALASANGLLLRIEGKRHDPRIPPDRIMAQEPPPGANLKAQRSVRVWVSLGPRRLVVPAVEGASLRTARLELEQAGVGVARIAQVGDAAPEGTVLVQLPPPGEIEGAGAGAALLVSLGSSSRRYVMPDLIGRPAEQVREALERAGLRAAEVRFRSYPGVAPGIVLRQVPAAGHPVDPSTNISLEVSRP
jgi:serine/threonine-protein kinase